MISLDSTLGYGGNRYAQPGANDVTLFDQLLDENEIRVLIAALSEMGCKELADSFSIARKRLADVGFFNDEKLMVCELGTENGGFLDDIEKNIRNDDSMWQLDESLVKLLP